MKASAYLRVRLEAVCGNVVGNRVEPADGAACLVNGLVLVQLIKVHLNIE